MQIATPARQKVRTRNLAKVSQQKSMESTALRGTICMRVFTAVLYDSFTFTLHSSRILNSLVTITTGFVVDLVLPFPLAGMHSRRRTVVVWSVSPYGHDPLGSQVSWSCPIVLKIISTPNCQRVKIAILLRCRRWRSLTTRRVKGILFHLGWTMRH